jgi:cytochrome c oxidase subunit II
MKRDIFIILTVIVLSLLIIGCNETIVEEPVTEESTVKEFSITAKKWDFSPETITVNKGDLVKITITSTDVTHGFKIGAYDINEQFSKGEIKLIEFTADKEGEFPFYCSVPCGSGHNSMNGKLVVK